MEGKTPPPGKKLSSWKEIAAYLGQSERTCRRWEKELGLPIHRLEGSQKSRVFAFGDELNAWQSRKLVSNAAKVRDHSKPRKYLRPLFAAPAMVIVLVVLFRGAVDHQIAGVKIIDSAIAAVNDQNRELWRRDTFIRNLRENGFYLKHSNWRRLDFDNKFRNIMNLPLVITRDLNDDGDSEVLFVVKTADEIHEGVLICYDKRGNEIWRFTAGRVMKYGKLNLTNDFVIVGIDVADIDRDQNLEILIVSHYLENYPTQVAILDCKGRLLGEYWNSGQFNDFVFEDIDGDHQVDLLLAGQNQEYHKPCLVRLDPRDLRGFSPNTSEYSCPVFLRGSEVSYILFPQTEIDRLLGPGHAVDFIAMDTNESIKVSTNCSESAFRLTRDLEIIEVILGDNFQRLNANLAKEHKLTKELNPIKTAQMLSEGLLYRDTKNAGWVPHPAISYPTGR
jgi:hypothetical protein